jgi:hypothetical protein
MAGTPGTACGVTWVLSTPPILYEGFYWAEPGMSPGLLNTMFHITYLAHQQAGPLTMTFNKPVKKVTVRLQLYLTSEFGTPLYLHDGHYMEAFDSAGTLLGTKTFAAGDTIAQETISFPRMRKVVLWPVNVGQIIDRIDHHISFAVDSSCPPTGNALIDHPDFKERVDSMMKRANITGPVGSRDEWGAYVWDDLNAPNGIRLDPPMFSGTECTSTFPVPSSLDQSAVYHVHPHYAGDNMNIACGKTNASPYNPDFNGGASDKDWEFARFYNRDVYAITPEQIHKLPAGSQKKLIPNPNRWKKDAKGCWNHF